MRYELYSFHPNEDCYCFEKENDDIQELLAYALKENLPKWLCGAEADPCQWIYLDNTPSEYNILQLGFLSVPSTEECRERILQCKIAKYAQESEISAVGGDDLSVYAENYQEIVKAASAACDAICTKLFTYPPILHLLISGSNHAPLKK